MNDLSPAVERAIAAANAAGETTTVGWLQVLLADDEARPAMLLELIGHTSAAVLTTIERQPGTPLATDLLLRKAREHSIRLRADPEFTTDLMLLAILHEFSPLAESLGISLTALDAAVRSPLVQGPSEAPAPQADVEFALPAATDQSDAARIVDANLNRARESLRILDDYARFTRNDATLAELAKSLRHRLAELSASLPRASLLAARDTTHDVGSAIIGSGEYHRGSPLHVATVNCKRLQESLRSVEEYGKILRHSVARDAEAIRYEAYTLERALLGGSPLRERIAEAKLYVLLSGEACTASLDWTIAEAAAGGTDVFQLREKHLGDRELLARAKELRAWTRASNVLFIVNDRVDIAHLADADGVHLGQDDLSVQEARRMLGPTPLVGVSTHTIAQVRQAVIDGADYLGIGPTFPSTTKAFDSLAGVAFIEAAMQATSLPMFALGGINAKTIDEAVGAGATRVAVGAAIAAADEPRQAAATLRAALPG